MCSDQQVSRAGENGLLRDEQQHEAQEGVLEQVPDPWLRGYHGEPNKNVLYLRLLFDSHETSPISRIGKSREMKGRS